MRLFIFGLLASFSLILGSPCGAQSNSQAAAKNALNRFLTLNNQSKLKSAAAKNLLTGEATRFAQEANIGQFSVPDAFQLLDSQHAVARTQALNNRVPVTDVYLYLTLSGSFWKISALRALALTGVTEAAMQELQNKPKLTSQERSELANMKLTLSLDRDLRIHFKNHRPEFEHLRTLFLKKPNSIESYVQKLGLSAVSYDDNSNIEFLIGGIVDNTVGYIYSPSNKPPKINPGEYIWVEKIADKWYLYRTT